MTSPKIPAADTFDWTHPNPKEQQKMAEKWFTSMKPHLDRLTRQ